MSVEVHPTTSTSAETDRPTSTTKRTAFPVGTRKSALAISQTNLAIYLLHKSSSANHTFPIHSLATIGDKNQTTALHQFNAKSLWTTELEADLVAGTTDLIIHSLKDMPTQLPEGCSLGAAVLRTDKRDCVVMSPQCAAKGWRTLADLPAGSVVGTSSVRRLAQLRMLFPELKGEDVRGNMGTRLAKLDDEREKESGGVRYAALILAAAGLQRLDLGNRISSFLSRREGGWLGAVGQGAIGVEIRSADKEIEALCEGMMVDREGSVERSSRKVFFECLAERMMLRTLEGGCSVPIGVETEWQGDELVMYALVSSVDGKQSVQGNLKRRIASREEAEEFGLAMAADLIQKGAEDVLKPITLNRKIIAEAGGA